MPPTVLYCAQATPNWTIVNREGDDLCGRGKSPTCSKKEPTKTKMSRHQKSQACFSPNCETMSGEQRVSTPYIAVFNAAVEKIGNAQEKFDDTGGTEGVNSGIEYGGEERGWLITPDLLETILRTAYKRTLAGALQLKQFVAGDSSPHWRGFVLAGESLPSRHAPLHASQYH